MVELEIMLKSKVMEPFEERPDCSEFLDRLYKVCLHGLVFLICSQFETLENVDVSISSVSCRPCLLWYFPYTFTAIL